jgi:hypothetical protein
MVFNLGFELMDSKIVIRDLYQTTRFLSKVNNERLQEHGIY